MIRKLCTFFVLSALFAPMQTVQAQAPSWLPEMRMPSLNWLTDAFDGINLPEVDMPDVNLPRMDVPFAENVIDPINTSFGDTIGNPMRRVLLSSIEGRGRTSISVGTMFLERSRNNGDVLIRPGTGAAPLSARDLNLGSDAGWMIGLETETGDNTSVEVRYFNVDQLDQGTTRSGVIGVGFNVIPLGIGAFNVPVNAQIDYAVALHNFEINGRRRMNEDVQFLFGFRHIQNNENFGGFFTAPAFPGSTNTVNFDARNYLSGIQTGVDVVLFERNGFSIEGLIKGGIYYNHASTSYSAVGAGLLAGTNEHIQDREDDVAFVGEIELAAVYAVTENVNLRAAYQFLALTNIATATNQVVSTNRTNLTSPTNTSESPIYQGLNLMVEVVLP